MSDQRRIFMLVSYVVDDNDDICSEPIPLGGTSSEKVARELVSVLREHHNATCTPIWNEQIDRLLPLELSEVEKELISETESEEKIGSLSNLVDF